MDNREIINRFTDKSERERERERERAKIMPLLK
jgi:hypothetical protein